MAESFDRAATRAMVEANYRATTVVAAAKRWSKALIATILLVAGTETAGAANLAIVTCPDEYGPVVFSLDLNTHSVVSAIDKSFDKSRFMFGGVPLSITDAEFAWVWKDDHSDMGNGPIKGVIRKYVLDRYTMQMTTEVLISGEYYQYHHKCHLTRRTL
jgi:hypothetical protein